MLVFLVGRTRLDRYEELGRRFAGWRDVRVVLDRREGDRRGAGRQYEGADRRWRQRRRRPRVEQELSLLGWSVIDTDEAAEPESAP